MSFGLKTKQRRRDEGDQKFSPKRKIQLQSEICNTNTLYDWWWLGGEESDWEVKGGAQETHPPIHPSNLVTSYSYFSFNYNGLKRKDVWGFLAVLLLFSQPWEPWGRKKKRGKDICFIECGQCPPDFAALVIRLQDLPPWSLLTLLKGKSEHTAPINKPKQT